MAVALPGRHAPFAGSAHSRWGPPSSRPCPRRPAQAYCPVRGARGMRAARPAPAARGQTRRPPLKVGGRRGGAGGLAPCPLLPAPARAATIIMALGAPACWPPSSAQAPSAEASGSRPAPHAPPTAPRSMLLAFDGCTTLPAAGPAGCAGRGPRTARARAAPRAISVGARGIRGGSKSSTALPPPPAIYHHTCVARGHHSTNPNPGRVAPP
ncbi:MAG: hypothetical protein J3K34DRAFT_272564 [Monoraphidium minutum]|nr:MAG: hypothetical protein J3K34DRAFT_272564 [Monoraphidium minutum]